MFIKERLFFFPENFVVVAVVFLYFNEVERKEVYLLCSFLN